MAIFGKKEQQIVMDGIWNKNPIAYLVMGICSALAVTVKVETALLMAIGTSFVLSFACMVISFLRNYIPSNVRIIIQLTVIASLVIIVDQVMKAYAYEISKQMSVFVGLIITNTLVMGRTEGYAMNNPPWPSFLDGLGNAIGYSGMILTVAGMREIFGSGTFLGFQVIPQAFYQAGYINNSMLLLAPGAFFLLAAIVCLQRSISGYKEEQQ